MADTITKTDKPIELPPGLSFPGIPAKAAIIPRHSREGGNPRPALKGKHG